MIKIYLFAINRFSEQGPWNLQNLLNLLVTSCLEQRPNEGWPYMQPCWPLQEPSGWHLPQPMKGSTYHPFFRRPIKTHKCPSIPKNRMRRVRKPMPAMLRRKMRKKPRTPRPRTLQRAPKLLNKIWWPTWSTWWVRGTSVQSVSWLDQHLVRHRKPMPMVTWPHQPLSIKLVWRPLITTTWVVVVRFMLITPLVLPWHTWKMQPRKHLLVSCTLMNR